MNQPLNQNVRAFNNYDYYHGKLPADDLKKIKELCQVSNAGERANSHLAGFIENEYVLKKECKNLVLPHIYEGACSMLDNPSMKWMNLSSWVNYQKKYEVNPLHNHTGMLSYVMWINIPYNLDDELNLDNVKDSTVRQDATAFTFVYMDVHGTLRQQPFQLTKENEGDFIIFPAQVHHMVMPFYTSDDYRISIAGNIAPRN